MLTTSAVEKSLEVAGNTIFAVFNSAGELCKLREVAPATAAAERLWARAPTARASGPCCIESCESARIILRRNIYVSAAADVFDISASGMCQHGAGGGGWSCKRLSHMLPGTMHVNADCIVTVKCGFDTC